MEENQVIYNWDAPWVIESKQQSNNEQLAYQQYLDESKKYGREPFTFEQWKSTQNSQYQPLVNDPKAKPGKGKTLNEKAKNYNKPLKGVAQRFEASMDNETNPYWGLNTMAKVVGAAGVAYAPIAAFKYGPQFVSTIATQPHGWQNLAVSAGSDLLAGTTGSIIGSKVDKAVGGDGTLGGVLGGFGAIYGLNSMPWKQDLNTALYRTHANQQELDNVILDRPDSYEGSVWGDDKTGFSVFPIEGKPHYQIKQADLPGRSSVWQWDYSKPSTVEIHLGHPLNPPSNPKQALKSAVDLMHQLPSGSNITPVSTAQSRTNRYYYQGFFSKKPKLISPTRIPASYDGYRTMMRFSKQPGFTTDIAENMVITKFEQPTTPTNSTLQTLHQEALKTKNITELNDYLVNKLGGLPAKLNKNGEIEFNIPIFYKK